MKKIQPNSQKLFIGLLFIVLAILVLIPAFRVGFTTADDLENYLITRRGFLAIFNQGKEIARDAGRFYFYIAQPLYKLPYLIDNFFFTKLVQYISLLITYTLFAKLVYKIFHSTVLSQMVFLFLLVCTFISDNQHIPIQAYPFLFTFSFSICIGALLLYVDYHNTQQRKYLWGSVVLFFVSTLFYETFVLFLLFFICYIFIQKLQQFGKHILKAKDFWKDILPYAGIGILYVIIYVGYRYYMTAFYPDLHPYDGAAVASNFSLSHFFRIIYKCTTYIIPGQVYSYHHELIAANSDAWHIHDNIWFMLTHAPIQAYMEALVCGGLVYWFVKHSDVEKLQIKHLYIALPVTLFLAFFSHTLIGIAEKYNQDWWSWMHGYVTSFYSYFFIMLFIALVSVILIAKTYNRIWLRRVLIVFLVGTTIFFTILISHSNDNLSREWQRSQHRFTFLDHIIASKYFDHIEDDAIVYTEPLYNSIHWGNQITGSNNLVDQYICIKSHRDIRCAKDEETLNSMLTNTPDAPVYYFYYATAPKTNETMWAITRMRENDIPKTDVYYLSPHKSYTVFVDSKENCPALIEGTYQQDFSTGLNAFNVSIDARSADIIHVHIQAAGLSPKGIAIGDIYIPNAPTYELPRQRKP